MGPRRYSRHSLTVALLTLVVAGCDSDRSSFPDAAPSAVATADPATSKNVRPVSGVQFVVDIPDTCIQLFSTDGTPIIDEVAPSPGLICVDDGDLDGPFAPLLLGWAARGVGDFAAGDLVFLAPSGTTVPDDVATGSATLGDDSYVVFTLDEGRLPVTVKQTDSDRAYDCVVDASTLQRISIPCAPA
jgi:hypothetical protein